MNATHLSDPVLFSRLVVFSIIPVFLSVGLIGNIFVIYIYARQSQKSNVDTFILVLAVNDLIGCIFGMPLEMAELYPAIQSDGLCKLYKFIVFINSLMSSMILLVIAVERYRKICCPHGKQMTLKLRRILIFLTTVISVALVLPVLFHFDGVPFIHENKIYVICGCDLRRSSLWFYALAALIINIMLFLSMTVLYILVQKTIAQRSRKRQRGKAASQARTNQSHTNIVLILISILLFISFSPTLIFFVMYPYFKDSNSLQICKVVLYRTWILNSSLNPMVYGFCNKIFRKSFADTFTRSKSTFETEEKF
ncbi:neuropeptide Y receptor type 6 [Octopus bimaculoides]|uniref:G-protein coupled receptors family 1 profile domain-containing protein n=1 Tax=Octopus bimaculoides TaxID=37653 RepID=A0A0L8I459_OCTBM|nr:neuropeptide Y receptor type 6 [Octopus bimaculoides]|eukprot:XP_014790998.1 PREDICTED: neuropeptide FF receptor 2-like [Octopus bimaculoides]